MPGGTDRPGGSLRPVVTDASALVEYLLRTPRARRLLSEERARSALIDFLDLPLVRHGHQALLARILELAGNFSAYDATYVALAERIAAPLLTADRRLVRAARSHAEVSILEI